MYIADEAELALSSQVNTSIRLRPTWTLCGSKNHFNDQHNSKQIHVSGKLKFFRLISTFHRRIRAPRTPSEWLIIWNYDGPASCLEVKISTGGGCDHLQLGPFISFIIRPRFTKRMPSALRYNICLRIGV